MNNSRRGAVRAPLAGALASQSPGLRPDRRQGLRTGPAGAAHRHAGKIEVLEFFSYGCPHCNDFNPLIHAWALLPADVVFRKVPITFWPRRLGQYRPALLRPRSHRRPRQARRRGLQGHPRRPGQPVRRQGGRRMAAKKGSIPRNSPTPSPPSASSAKARSSGATRWPRPTASRAYLRWPSTQAIGQRQEPQRHAGHRRPSIAKSRSEKAGKK